jgi:hypothetical protein
MKNENENWPKPGYASITWMKTIDWRGSVSQTIPVSVSSEQIQIKKCSFELQKIVNQNNWNQFFNWKKSSPTFKLHGYTYMVGPLYLCTCTEDRLAFS